MLFRVRGGWTRVGATSSPSRTCYVSAYQVLTSSFSDGAPGPVAFCLPEGKISPQEALAFNRANHGRAYVLTSGTDSHFMTGEVLAVLLDQLISPALEKQRLKILECSIQYFFDLFMRCLIAASFLTHVAILTWHPVTLLRLRYGLNKEEHRAALLCNAWTGTFSTAAGLDLRRPFIGLGCYPLEN